MNKPAPRAVPQALSPSIEKICRHLEAHSDEPWTLEQLGRMAHLSPHHLQRRFKAEVGVSPKQYASAWREKRLRQGLRQAATVTEAIYDAGFGSTSRAYEGAVNNLGMTPRQYRAGGQGVSIAYAFGATALGPLLLGATERGLCFVQFDDSKAALKERLAAEYPRAELVPMAAEAEEQFGQWMQALAAHLEGRAAAPDLPLDIHGTAFQIQVWRYLQSIPSGELRSYGEVAAGIGRPKAVRAVATACASNRVAVLIPCHRVIRGDGGLGGYRWGLERKRALIDQERSQAQ